MLLLGSGSTNEICPLYISGSFKNCSSLSIDIVNNIENNILYKSFINLCNFLTFFVDV